MIEVSGWGKLGRWGVPEACGGGERLGTNGWFLVMVIFEVCVVFCLDNVASCVFVFVEG